MEASKIIELEKEHIMQSYGRFNIVLDKGKGCYLYDVKGEKYLDFIGGIACVTVGHANEKVVEAISKQAGKIIHVSNIYYTKEQVLLAQKLSKISGLGKCFFANSGAEANEAAIKLAKKVSGKSEFIVCKDAFHGRTHGSLSATWKEKYKEPFKPLVSGFSFVNYNDVGAVKTKINSKTAAVIVEPIQGEAGVKIPDDDYLTKLSELCKEKKVLLILDEVQTGNGRTGKYFCYQHYGIKPDIVTTAKGLGNGVPIGVCMSDYEFGLGEHATTFGGNSLVCAAANATISYIQDNKLEENAAILGNYFASELKKIKSIKQVRGKGLMIGIDIGSDAKDFCVDAMQKGLLCFYCTEKTVRFLPPLTVTKNDVDCAINIIKEVLKDD